MIAQPVLTTPSTAKPQAQQQQQPNANGFQSLLSMTDSSLTDVAQNVGASGTPPQPANTNKPKSNDPDGTPYVAPPYQHLAPPSQPTAPAGSPADANSSSPIMSAAAANALVAATTDGAAGTAPGTATTPSGATAPATATAPAAGDQNGNSTAFGADSLNARIVAGAPIYSSQPNAAMATVPAHLLDAANSHPLPGEPTATPGTDASGKAPASGNAAVPATAASAATTAAQVLPIHPTIAAATGDSSKDNGATSAPTADSDTTAAADSDANTSGTPLLAQPTAPQTAPVQVDAAVHTPAPYVPVGEQVALNLKQAIASDNNEIRIQLKPASLGTIDVKLNVGQDGRVNAVISADRSDTLNMLKQDAGTLQQALRDVGLNADNSSLSFNLRGDAQGFAQNWSQGGTGGNGNGGTRAGYPGSAGDALLAADAIAPSQRVHAGALDIEV